MRLLKNYQCERYLVLFTRGPAPQTRNVLMGPAAPAASNSAQNDFMGIRF